MHPNSTYLVVATTDEAKEAGNPNSEWLLLESQRSFSFLFEDTIAVLCRLATGTGSADAVLSPVDALAILHEVLSFISAPKFFC